MDISTQGNLCKGLRACGIPKTQAHHILNEVEKWYDESGPRWTNDRIKDLRQWYETCLAGEPKPPKWFKHSDSGYPLGIWKWVFDLPKAKALGVLSLNTVFYEKELSETQKEKFLHGLNGNGTQNPELLDELLSPIVRPMIKHLPKEMPEIRIPTVFDMTGSIPVHDGQHTIRPNEKLGLALEALELSWESVPQVTFDFLDRQDLLGYMPVDVLGNEYQLELDRPHSSIVGRVSVLQQPQLKARIVGNPNRVTQVTLEPLKQIYMDLAKKLPTDVTHNQELGVHWVQSKLKEGISLSGSDMTSASDLLDIGLSLKLVDRMFGFSRIRGYQEYADYFVEVCRADWACPALGHNVSWKQGDVLGTGPSFGLLTLTNNAAGFLAYLYAVKDHVIDPSDRRVSDSFRVVGDDIIMISEMESYYTQIIESLGGEINHSKTLKSDKVAEFAGRVITSDAAYLKAIKYSEPSDNSFMSYMSQLGDQAKYLLKPNQRRVYDRLKEVPGILVDGPWMQDSYGVPLGLRYSWYLEEVQPALSREEPDLLLTDYSFVLLQAQLSNDEASIASHGDLATPFLEEGYLPSQVTNSFKVGGDPRLVDGRELVDVLINKIGDIKPFSVWLTERNQSTSDQEEIDTATETLVSGEEIPVAKQQYLTSDYSSVSSISKLVDQGLLTSDDFIRVLSIHDQDRREKLVLDLMSINAQAGVNTSPLIARGRDNDGFDL